MPLTRSAILLGLALAANAQEMPRVSEPAIPPSSPVTVTPPPVCTDKFVPMPQR